MINTGELTIGTIPLGIDPENHALSATASWNGGLLPGFMSFDGVKFIFEPVKGVDQGSFYIQVILNDGYQDMTTPAIFKLTLN
jgi:hypothetical protein